MSRDTANLKFLQNNSLCLQEDVFNTSGFAIKNLSDGENSGDAVIVCQLDVYKLYVKSELYKVLKVFETFINTILSYIYKVHAQSADSTLCVDQSDLKVNDNAETRVLIKDIDERVTERSLNWDEVRWKAEWTMVGNVL